MNETVRVYNRLKRAWAKWNRENLDNQISWPNWLEQNW
jgi:hypothetical protein